MSYYRSLTLALLLVLPLMIASCDDDNNSGGPLPDNPLEGNGTLSFKFQGEVNGETFELNQVYTDSLSNSEFFLEFVKMYISPLRIRELGGDTTTVSMVELVDLGADTAHSFDVSAGEYEGLNFGIGLPNEINSRQKASSYPLDHVLHTGRGMYWSWASLYKFIRIDGKADTVPGDGVEDFTYGLDWHEGFDQFYRTYEFSDEQAHRFQVKDGQTTTITLTFDIDRWLRSPNGSEDNINLRNESSAHTMEDADLMRRMVDNVGGSMSISVDSP